jgi:DNA-binding beta-propeller fold protein YncE
MAYDALHDVIVASAPMAGSIVFLRGGANGEEPPLRVIQGPKTQLRTPFQVAVDTKHNELWVANLAASALLAFPLEGNGDIAPLRVIGGSKTGLRFPSGVAVDPDRNVVVAISMSPGATAGHRGSSIRIFNRTDNGDVTPKGVIAGPSTGIVSGWHVQAYGGKIFATATNNLYERPYDSGGYAPKQGCKGPSLAWVGPPGFVGVWNETDSGDVPPRAIVRGPMTDLVRPGGLAIDPIHRELIVSDSARNGMYGFLVPDFF